MQLVIPCRNEESRLPATLQALRAHLGDRSLPGEPLEVVVVDNGSVDRTADAALAEHSVALPVRVVHCAEPGKGAAVRAGVAATVHDQVGFMDADGATSLDALEEVFRRLAHGADVVIGSRGLPDSVTMVRTSWLRARGAEAYRALAGRIVPAIADTQCGFKFFDGPLARRLFLELRTTGFAFDVEILARAQGAGARITEVPVTWVDVPGSTFAPARHGAASFADLARIAHRLRSERRARTAVPYPASLAPAPELDVPVWAAGATRSA